MSQSAQSAQSAPQAAPALSAGTLFYLFGDRCVAPAGTFGGTTLPSGAKVQAGDLSALLWAASIWNLRQTGALTLSPVTKKSLGMFKVQHVELAMGSHVVQKSGYEDVVMRAVGSGTTLAHDVIHQWYGRDVVDPEGHTFGLARRELVQFGLAREVDAERGAVGGFLLGRTRIEPIPETISPWWEHFTRVHPAWVQFTQAESELADTLLETCRKAIRNRQESDDDRDF